MLDRLVGCGCAAVLTVIGLIVALIVVVSCDDSDGCTFGRCCQYEGKEFSQCMWDTNPATRSADEEKRRGK